MPFDQYFDQNRWAIALGILTPLIVALIKYWFSPRTKLLFGVLAETYFPVRLVKSGDTINTFTRTLIIRNAGLKAANKIIIGLGKRPSVWVVNPPIPAELTADGTGTWFLRIERIPPRAHIFVETISEDAQPNLLSVTHEDGIAQRAVIEWYARLSALARMFIYIAFAGGTALIFYAIWRFILLGANAAGWL